VEHLHDTGEEPRRVVDVDERKLVRDRRLRQLEALAFAVYRRIVGDPVLRTRLGTDAGIDEFRAMPDADRAILWNVRLDFSALP